jgi:Ca2+-transporting ATPase
MTTVHQTPEGTRTAFVKGAPEVVLDLCSAELAERGPATLDREGRHALLAAAAQMASEGLRVLALAYREIKADEVESDLTLLGLVGMIDPPREESIQAVRTCREIGIRPVMITGDHKLTAMAVAREVDIYRDGDTALSGEDLAALSDDEFEAIVERVSVYARVSPADKLRIVSAWKKRGDIVAMTGDGVNDAPALKHADVGIAMGITGTEVSKEAADIVLADDNFATILNAVEMGRWVYDNIKKYLTYLLRANIVEVTVIGGVALFKGVEYLPMLPAAILYINLITDGLPAIALGFSPAEPDLMQRPPRNPRESVFSPDVKAFIFLSLVFAPVFFWVFFSADTVLIARTRLFFLFILVELGMALNLRSLRYSLLAVPPHGWLVASVIGSIAVTALAVTLPPLREAFGITIPRAEGIGIALGVVLAVTVLTEAVKAGLRKRDSRSLRL